MRTAERTRYWSTLRERPQRRVQLNSFSFSGIPGLKDGVIQFRSPITAICGVNGTGKSSLLRGIWATLRWHTLDTAPEIKQRLEALSSEAIFSIEDVPTHFYAPNLLSDQAQTVECVHLDPASMATPLQRKVCEINNLSEMLEPLEPIHLESAERELVSFILNKKYDSVSIYEIDDYADEDPFPVISVSEAGSTYDSRTMSLGEISIFMMFWLLRRIQDNTLVLLEEPETFLSPVSQGALLDYLAALCVRKRLTVVLTTHSPQMFGRLSKEQVRFCYRSVLGLAKLAGDEEFEQMRHAVGIEPRTDLIVLVEDRLAREFATEILRRYDLISLARAVVVDLGGTGNVDTVANLLADKIKTIAVIAVYDGDARKAAHQNTWPTAFLPGERPLEQLFREIAEEQLERLAVALGRDVAALDIELTQIKALDYHDWYIELARRLHITYVELLHVLIGIWISDSQNEAAVENFVFDFHQTLKAAWANPS